MEGVFPVGARLHGSRVASTDIGDDDGRAGYRGFLIVSDCAANRSGGHLSVQRAGTGECDKKSTAKHEGCAEIEIDAGEERRLVLHSFTPPRRISSLEQSAAASTCCDAFCLVNLPTQPTLIELRTHHQKNCTEERNTFLLGPIYSPARNACQAKMMIFRRKIMLFYAQ